MSRVRFLAGCVVAAAVAWASYFALLFATDSLLGGRQLLSELLFGSKRRLVIQSLEIVADSAWVVLPVVVAGMALLAWRAVPFRVRAVSLRAAGMAVVTAAALLLYGFAPAPALIFAVALGCALLAGAGVMEMLRGAH